jgi:hypothetical protein
MGFFSPLNVVIVVLGHSLEDGTVHVNIKALHFFL